MLLFFVLFIFFILHIQFLLRNILFDLDEITYFEFTIKYGFDRDVALQSLFFSLACAVSFAVCYKVFYRKQITAWIDARGDGSIKFAHSELLLMNFVGVIMITYMMVVIGMARFDYGAMVVIRESNGFIFELRMIFLLLLSHILLNVSWGKILSLRELKAARWIVLVYFICTLIFQARSAVFELFAIIAFSQLMWAGDKVKIKYITVAIGVLLVPNLIVLGRLGIPEDPYELINGLFSFEYSIVMNNFLSAAITSGADALREISFMPSLQLLIPSPLRDLLGMAVVKSSYYSDLSVDANNFGGGFSLLAEMYSNFGWISLVVFGVLGALIGHWNSRAARVGKVAIPYAAAPLIYAAFILVFRNDFGVFLKYAIQLVVISAMLSLLLPNRVEK